MNSSQYLNGIIILITILAMYCNELSIKIDMECDFGGSDIPRVCVFIEVFEDEPMYEQLLRNHSRCIITDLIHFSRELENKDYFYPEGEKHRVRVGIPPIKFRKVLRNQIFITDKLKDQGRMRACSPRWEGCGCILRPTFDSEWLKKTNERVYNNYSHFVFNRPEITYPDCNAISALCPPQSKVVAYSHKTKELVTDTPPLEKNPFILSELFCIDGEWFKRGVGSEDSMLTGSPISCATTK